MLLQNSYHHDVLEYAELIAIYIRLAYEVFCLAVVYSAFYEFINLKRIAESYYGQWIEKMHMLFIYPAMKHTLAQEGIAKRYRYIKV